MKYLLLASTLFIGITAFSQNNMDFVIWGSYCGECKKNCATFYKITNDGTILVDKTEKYFWVHDEPYTFQKNKKSDKIFKEYKWLLSEIPQAIYDFPNGEIGEPDHFDQCGYYLQIKSGDRINYWQIDPLKIPAELKDFVDLLYKTTANNG